MKKVSLLALILSATAANWAASADQPASAHCPKAFQGFGLGGNVGYGIGWGKRNVTDTFPGFSPNVTRSDLGVRGIDGGIGVSYLHRMCGWGLGLAFDANWANTKGRHSFTVGGTGNTFTHRARLKNSLQLYAKLGHVLCGEQVMPFVGLGWDNSAWKKSFIETTSAGTTTFAGSQTKRHNGFLWKVGVDFLLTKHLIGGFEYTGTTAGRKSFSTTRPGTTSVRTSSWKPQYNKVALTLRVVY